MKHHPKSNNGFFCKKQKKSSRMMMASRGSGFDRRTHSKLKLSGGVSNTGILTMLAAALLGRKSGRG